MFVNKLLPLLIACLMISACTVAVLKKDTHRFDGNFRGDNSSLARCLASKLENDKKLVIRSLRLDVRSYPDIATVEVRGTEVTTTIIAEHFLLTLRQDDPESVYAEVSGLMEDTSALVWEYLEECSKNK